MTFEARWGESQPEPARARRTEMEIEVPDPFPAVGSHIGASADGDREQNRRGRAGARRAGAPILGSRLTHFEEPAFAFPRVLRRRVGSGAKYFRDK